jgi:amino acid transporter
VVTFVSLTFVFIQSLFIITDRNKKHHKWIIIVFILVLFITWFEVFFKSNSYINLFRFLLYLVFFAFTIASLFRFMSRARKINQDVVIISMVIYLLLGILGGATAFFFYHMYPNAFNFAHPDAEVDLLKMTYFGFVTLSTLGYGDITPARPETQTLSYLLAVTGQLYVAIIVAFIVSKFIAHNPEPAEE